MKQVSIAVIFVLLGIGVTKSHATEPTWTIGLVGTADQGIYEGQGDEVNLFPYIQFEYGVFSASLHEGLALHVGQIDGAEGQSGSISLVLTPRWSPDYGSGALFAGLDRDTAIEAGVTARYGHGILFVEGTALVDISGTHKGYEASTAVGVEYELGALNMQASVGARYRNSDLNQYLFGVGANEVTAARTAFEAKSTTTGFASISALYALGDKAALVGEIAYEDLGRSANSPLVGESSNTSLAIGVLYQF